MRTTTSVVLALALLASVGPSSGLAAQGQTLAFMYEVTPHLGSASAFESAWKDHMEFRAAEGDSWTWSVFEVVYGDRMGNYLIRSPNHSWADMDAYNAMSDFQQAVGMHVTGTIVPHIANAVSRVSSQDTALSHIPPNVADMNVFGITTYRMKAENQLEMNDALQQYHEAGVAADLYHAIVRPIFGGGAGPSFTVVTYGENFAGLEAPSPSLLELMVQRHGADDAEDIARAFLSGVESIETSVIVLRRDLSTPPS